MTTHKEAVEAAILLSRYCEDRELCGVDGCVFADIEYCPVKILTDKEIRIAQKEAERLERKENAKKG